MAGLLYEVETYDILGACFKVSNEMGCGFLESVYQECLEIELEILNIPFRAQQEMQLHYRGQKLTHYFKPDLICHEKIVVELKAVSTLADEHRAQVLNYLNATKLKLGLLVNFGHYPKLQYERFVLTQKGARKQSLPP